MNPEEFKKRWSPDKYLKWMKFNQKELTKSPLKEATKLFLKNGFKLNKMVSIRMFHLNQIEQ